MGKKETLLLVAPVLLIVAVILFIAYVYSVGNSPEIVIGGFLVLGVIVLILALTFTTYIFSILGLSNPFHALGLPEGSVRAVIALSLILIFITSSVFLYWYGAGQKITSHNVPQEMIDFFPNSSIVDIDLKGHSNNTSLYDVTVLVPRTPASEDLAKQLVTTVSTLAVAVAGFYFGTQAVVTAQGRNPSTPEPLIRSIDPNNNNGKRNDDIPFEISGKNFNGPKVRLIQDSKTIEGDHITSSATTIKGTLKIEGPDKHPAGSWTVVVTNEDKGEDKLEHGYTISDSQDQNVPQSPDNKKKEENSEPKS